MSARLGTIQLPSALPRPASATSIHFNGLLHIAVPMLLIAVAIVFQAKNLQLSHEQYKDRARLTALNLGSTIAASIAGSFQNIDITLSAVTDHARQQQGLKSVDKQAFNTMLSEIRRRVPSLSALRVTNASGEVLFGLENAVGLNAGDRAYFQQLKANPNAGMVISEPVFGRGLKKWVVICARRFNLPNGEFAGVVFAAVELDGMAERLLGKEMKLGDQDEFVLFDNDPRVVIRYVHGKQDMQVSGKKIISSNLENFINSTESSRFAVKNSSIDDIERIFYVQRIAGQPLGLVVGLSTDDVFFNWRREAWNAWIITSIFSLVVLVGAYLTYRANHRLAQLSTTDGLTGLPNRREYVNIGELEWQRAMRNKEWFAVAMVDIDHFKAYNDHYGHQAGDQCLCAVAQTLAAGLRNSSDFIARYGGEEFIVILPGQDALHAYDVLDRLRREVEALALPHAANKGSSIVTFSAGVAAVVPKHGSTLAACVEVADQHLYEAKRKGRNQIYGA